MTPPAPMSPGMTMPQSAAPPMSGMAMMNEAGSLPERLERHEAMMSGHLEALRKVRAALAPLYGALSPDQRARLDAMPAHPPAH